jgi:hypothetical protein
MAAEAKSQLVEATGPDQPPPGELGTAYIPDKVLVAVHGIGNQFKYATIQSVAYAFFRYFGMPGAIPLGRFHRLTPGPYVLDPDLRPKDVKRGFGFVEVYWADIPREVVKANVLEQAQAWARTLVERIRLRYEKAPQRKKGEIRLNAGDFDMLETVVTELIQGVDVLDRLFFLAEKMGLFSFKLKELLSDFLGDVQIVTEFSSERENILRQFRDKMKEIHQANAAAEIFIVAHSEGTVVAFLGLLDALSAEDRPPWIGQVKGLMTIGSPINKHVICWPELWEKYQGKAPKVPAKPEERLRIVWHNYYDLGDPIGFKLDRTRELLEAHGWMKRDDGSGVFVFPNENDHGFSRYYLPGKAHNDYFKDKHVFGHFIQQVIHPVEMAEQKREYNEPPGNKFWPKFISFGLYLIPFVLLFVGCYFNYQTVHTAVGQDDPVSGREMFIDVLLLTGLLGSITVVARIPRLSRAWLLSVGAFALFGVALVCYALFATPHLRMALGEGPVQALDRMAGARGRREVLAFYDPATRTYSAKGKSPDSLTGFGHTFPRDPAGEAARRSEEHRGDRVQVLLYQGDGGLPGGVSLDRWTSVVLVLAVALCLGNYVLCRTVPAIGLKLLMGTGIAISLGLVGWYVWGSVGSQPIWPVFLSGAVFAYLWWLATIFFDLIFTWRRYIRQNVAIKRLEALVPLGSGTPASIATPGNSAT